MASAIFLIETSNAHQRFTEVQLMLAGGEILPTIAEGNVTFVSTKTAELY